MVIASRIRTFSGVIGIFGPTRMAYAQMVPAVRTMAHALGEVLTRLSME